MRKMIISIVALFFVSTLFSEDVDFQEFRRRQRADFISYREDQKIAFSNWREERENLLKSWREVESRYAGTSVRSVTVEEINKDLLIKEDVDYQTGETSVSISSFSADSLQAVEEALSAMLKAISSIVLEQIGDESVKSRPEQVAVYSQEVVDRAEVVVKKGEDGYIASAKAETALYGEGGVVSLIEESFVEPAKELEPLPDLSPYTSLIVSAEVTGFGACLVPLFIDQQGEQVYGPLIAQKEYAVNGMAHWVTSLEEAKAHEVVGSDPLTITALDSPAKRRLLLSEYDARLLQGLRSQSSILQECRVIIVVK